MTIGNQTYSVGDLFTTSKSRGQFFAHKAFIRQKYGQAELDRLEYLSKKLVVQRRDDWYLKKIDEYNSKLTSLKEG